MRILYVCRLFSGFEASLENGQWNPIGAPTIARMIEKLDRQEDVTPCFVFTAKDFGSGWDSAHDQVITCANLHTPFHVLAGQSIFPSWLGRLRDKMRDTRQLLALWAIYKRFKPDLIFCDRVNILPAAFFARFTRTPVIWRIMGVLDNMHQNAVSSAMRSKFIRMLWRSPFTDVICTLDGSGGGPWMKKVLNPHTQTHMLVNGFDASVETSAVALPDHPFKVLHAGRIEHLKGLDVLLGAAQNLKESGHNDIMFVMAGYGSAEAWMKTQIEQRGLEPYFHFTGPLDQAQMRFVRLAADVSVSCGTHGNMTNTVIESLSDGVCTILPEPDQIHGIDIDTHDFVSDNAAFSYGPQPDFKALADLLIDLKQHPDKRQEAGENARIFSRSHIPTWEARMNQEFSIYQKALKA